MFCACAVFATVLELQRQHFEPAAIIYSRLAARLKLVFLFIRFNDSQALNLLKTARAMLKTLFTLTHTTAPRQTCQSFRLLS
jgi:hypothetical protein